MASFSPRAQKMIVIAVMIGLIGIGCATKDSVFKSLLNHGIIPVSSDNPYLGANLYLAKEMEGSLYLYNFIKKRGAPRAIELVGESERSTEMNLYYSKAGEVFRATAQVDPVARSKEWIVRGPYALDRENYRAVTQLGPEAGGVFEIFGRREVLGAEVRGTESRVIAPAFVPTPRPTPRPMRRKASRNSGTAPSVATTGIPSTPSNLDQEALLEARRKPATPPVAPAAPSKLQDPSAQTSSALDHALKDTLAKPGTEPAR